LTVLVVSPVLLAAFGCDSFQEFQKQREEAERIHAEKDAFVREYLPEVQIVLDDLKAAMQDHEARIKSREAMLRAEGRDPEKDVCRRWKEILKSMEAYRKNLDEKVMDAFAEYRRQRGTGTIDDRKVQKLAELQEKARKQAASVQRALERFEKEIGG